MENRVPTVIVGGGIAGLYLATKRPAALLLERRASVGGRVRTVHTPHGLYEAGPWRVHESHAKMLALVREYGLTVRRNTSSKADRGAPEGVEAAKAGFSEHDVRVLAQGAEYARAMDVLSGYEGMAAAASDANVYHANRHVGGAYHYVVEGFGELVARMAKRCQGRVRTKSLVTDVARHADGHYLVHVQGRAAPIACDEVFCCVPPRFMEEWPSVRGWVRPQTACVRTAPLCHVYATLKGDERLQKTFFRTTGELGQVISGENRWFQASYTAGRTAEFWNRLALDDQAFRAKVRGMVRGALRKEVDEVRAHFWQDAVHYWVPVYKTPTKDLVARAVVPHPVALPRFYCAGEAFSGTQGWCEGALQTAEAALLAAAAAGPPPPAQYPEKYVLFQGRILDVAEWMEVHPGTKALVEDRLGQDITGVFGLVDHSKNAYATVFGLQRGFAT